MIFSDNEALCKTLETREYNPFQDRLRWKDFLKEKLTGKYEVIKPDMPNKHMACYKARKIWFEKIFPYLNDEGLVVVGHSLGWMFLLKYISENWFPKKIKQLHLTASCLDETNMPEEEKYMGDFLFDLNTIPKVQDFVENIFIYHSTDDPVVPYEHAEKLYSYLPKAKLITLTDRGHIMQIEFPELYENLLK